MNSNNNISDQKNIEHIDFFKKVEVPFTKSKEDVWELLSEKLEKVDFVQPQGKLISMVWYKVAVAVVIVLVGSTSFMRLYTTTVFSEKGNHINHILPDGSLVELNAASQMSYHPYWWKQERTVNLEGEAFFEVKKGSRFNVESTFGNTEVLGTSFNVYTRNNAYKVFCKTGSVKVSNINSTVELILAPGDIAIINNKTNTGQIEKSSSENIISWRSNDFIFNKESLVKVVETIEIQYNVSILLDVYRPDELIYSGRFKMQEFADSTLELICQSFNLKFTSTGKKDYKISTNN